MIAGGSLNIPSVKSTVSLHPEMEALFLFFVFLFLNFKIHQLLNTDKSTKITIGRGKKGTNKSYLKRKHLRTTPATHFHLMSCYTMPKI